MRRAGTILLLAAALAAGLRSPIKAQDSTLSLQGVAPIKRTKRFSVEVIPKANQLWMIRRSEGRFHPQSCSTPCSIVNGYCGTNRCACTLNGQVTNDCTYPINNNYTTAADCTAGQNANATSTCPNSAFGNEVCVGSIVTSCQCFGSACNTNTTCPSGTTLNTNNSTCTDANGVSCSASKMITVACGGSSVSLCGSSESCPGGTGTGGNGGSGGGGSGNTGSNTSTISGSTPKLLGTGGGAQSTYNFFGWSFPGYSGYGSMPNASPNSSNNPWANSWSSLVGSSAYDPCADPTSMLYGSNICQHRPDDSSFLYSSAAPPPLTPGNAAQAQINQGAKYLNTLAPQTQLENTTNSPENNQNVAQNIFGKNIHLGGGRYGTSMTLNPIETPISNSWDNAYIAQANNLIGPGQGQPLGGAGMGSGPDIMAPSGLNILGGGPGSNSVGYAPSNSNGAAGSGSAGGGTCSCPGGAQAPPLGAGGGGGAFKQGSLQSAGARSGVGGPRPPVGSPGAPNNPRQPTYGGNGQGTPIGEFPVGGNGGCSCPGGATGGGCDGGTIVNGSCQCSGGQIPVNGVCQCPTGYWMPNNLQTQGPAGSNGPALGTCVPIPTNTGGPVGVGTVTDTPPPPPNCTGGQVSDGQGGCQCPLGETLVKGTCQSSGGGPGNGNPYGGGGYGTPNPPNPVNCAGGQIAVNGACQCPSGQTLVSGICRQSGNTPPACGSSHHGWWFSLRTNLWYHTQDSCLAASGDDATLCSQCP